MADTIQELPQPEIATESFSRSEMAAVLSLILTKNLSYDQAAALAVTHLYSPALAKYLSREFKKVLHPQFSDIIEALRPPAPVAVQQKGEKSK